MLIEAKPFGFRICGTDGSGKNTALENAYLQFLLENQNTTILEVGKPTRYWDGNRWTIVELGITRALDELHQRADKSKNPRKVMLASMMSVLFMWRHQARYWSEKYKPDMVVSIRDPHIDPAAYAPFYAPDTLGRLSIPDRIKVVKGLTGAPYPEEVVFLDLDPEIAVSRIEQRMAEEIRDGSDGNRPVKWLHLHENVDGLRNIRNEFYRVLNYMEGSQGTRVTRIDASQSKEAVAGELVARLKGMAETVGARH